ncbi:MAG: hypothetical protein ACR2I5_08590 [Candidatus Limnocylindria bacterium]
MWHRPKHVAGHVTLSILLLHHRYPEAKWLSEEDVRRVAAEEVMAELRGKPLVIDAG